MEKKRLLVLFWFLSTSALVSAAGSSSGKVEKLFVFGDSYADTGNTPPPSSKSWKPPYGITFPGKPSGRFSDGRVLTDYIASFLGIGSPSPYSQLKNMKPLLYNNYTQKGINFAYGGTGVFKTKVDLPNMTTQIDFLQQLLHKNLISSISSSSMALVSLAGNDYATFLSKNNGSFQGLPEFTKSVITQLTLNLKRISGFGIKKIAVVGIGSLGCLPRNTASASYQNCDEAGNKFSESHNQLLKQSLSKLNNETDSPGFIYLDLYGAFLSALKLQQNASGNIVANNLLRPCCAGVNGEDCGLVDMNRVNEYLVCPYPKQSFFWDFIHPTDAGWQAVYSTLAKESLPSLIQP